ncbi:MAG: GNVR domain-containing protein [Balneolaceae bacterium]|nr:GNVR domain-containing protein [Balneolaceae bacterium]
MSQEEQPHPTHYHPAREGGGQEVSSGTYQPAAAPDEGGIRPMEIMLFFWTERFIIGLFLGFFLVGGFVYASLSTEEYSAKTTLLPEGGGTQGMGQNLLRQYGGLLGINMQGTQGGEFLPTNIYPDILQSVPYQVELMSTPIYFEKQDTTVTPHTWFRELQPPDRLAMLRRYTLGLPWTVWGWIRGGGGGGGATPEPVATRVNPDSVLDVSGTQMATIGQLRGRISIMQTDNGLIQFTAELPDPQAAAELGNVGIELLKKYVSEYRTEKAQQDLEFVQQQYQQARERFQQAQIDLAEFRDSNLNPATNRATVREQVLQSEFDLASSVYNSLAQNLEQAKLRVQEETPVFTTVEPLLVPRGPSSPNTKLILVISAFLGVMGGVIFVLLRRQWTEFRQILRSQVS